MDNKQKLGLAALAAVGIVGLTGCRYNTPNTSGEQDLNQDILQNEEVQAYKGFVEELSDFVDNKLRMNYIEGASCSEDEFYRKRMRSFRTNLELGKTVIERSNPGAFENPNLRDLETQMKNSYAKAFEIMDTYGPKGCPERPGSESRRR